MAEAPSSSSSSAPADPEPGTSEEKTEKDFSVYLNPNWRMDLLVNRHAQYCRIILKGMSDEFEEYDSQRMTFLHFAVTSLDLLKSLSVLSEREITAVREWTYYLQISADPPERCGFQGAPAFFLDHQNKDLSKQLPLDIYSGHLTFTYSALVTLLTLGDDMNRIDRQRILRGVAALQKPNGGFKASFGCEETDMRFVYCAVCICYILNDFSLIDVTTLKKFIKDSMTHEGSFGSGSVGTEGHAAYTYCAVASLKLLGALEECLTPKEIDLLIRWCLMRQEFGFVGRPNKIEDTCYSYWVGATLQLLDSLSFSDRDRNVDFILSNQNPYGGIGKCDNTVPDPLHTLMGIAGLSLVQYKGLGAIDAALTMSEVAANYMKTLHSSWK